MTSTHVTKLEMTEMNVLMGNRRHGDHLSNYNIWERLPIECHREVQEIKTEVVWTREETRIRRIVPPGRRKRKRKTKQRWV